LLTRKYTQKGVELMLVLFSLSYSMNLVSQPLYWDKGHRYGISRIDGAG